MTVKTMKEILLNESDETKFAVVRLGGSIGGKSIRSVSQLKGIKNEDKDVFDTLEQATEKVKRMNKLLSPGEKKYYGIKYVVATIENGFFTGKSK